MVFALETYWPAADGWSAARIEEEVVVTADGCEVITKFPAEELLVAGRKYWTAGGALDTLRESQSNLNTAAGRGDDRTPEIPPQMPAGARPAATPHDRHHGSARTAALLRADGGHPRHREGRS